jgi:hypothetical protein
MRDSEKGAGFGPTHADQSTSRKHILGDQDEAIEFVNLWRGTPSWVTRCHLHLRMLVRLSPGKA